MTIKGNSVTDNTYETVPLSFGTNVILIEVRGLPIHTYTYSVTRASSGEFRLSTVNAAENAGNVTVSVYRDAGSSGPASVDYTT